jgi:glucose-1-phosphate thymidylyltransferase
MIYYPLSVLMLAGIRDILIISTPGDLPRFIELFGAGEQLGLNISYAEQPRPEGLAQAFLIGKDFIAHDSVALVLGDNIFFGQGFAGIVQRCSKLTDGGTIFGYLVKDPERYGVVEFDKNRKVIGIEEKPEKPKSRYAVPGLYFYDNSVVDIAASITPSPRGELEITDVNSCYLKQEKLTVELLGRGFCWLDTGTHESLQQASSYVQAVQDRQGLKIACIEEIAYRQGYITAEQVTHLAQSMLKNQYGQYLMSILEEGKVPGSQDGLIV